MLNNDYTLTITFTDGTTYTTPSIRGATGATGPQGPQGSPGSIAADEALASIGLYLGNDGFYILNS